MHQTRLYCETAKMTRGLALSTRYAFRRKRHPGPCSEPHCFPHCSQPSCTSRTSSLHYAHVGTLERLDRRSESKTRYLRRINHPHHTILTMRLTIKRNRLGILHRNRPIFPRADGTRVKRVLGVWMACVAKVSLRDIVSGAIEFEFHFVADGCFDGGGGEG